MRYLLVDDDDAFRGRLARTLRDRGSSVEEASDVHQARERFERFQASRVILDLRMPGPSGLEFLQWMKERSGYSNGAPKIVVLTGYGSIQTTEAALKLGALRYLVKPCSLDELLSAFDAPLGSAASIARTSPLPTLRQVEWEHIQRVLQDEGGNITKTAQRLGLDRRSLQRKLSKPPPLA